LPAFQLKGSFKLTKKFYIHRKNSARFHRQPRLARDRCVQYYSTFVYERNI